MKKLLNGLLLISNLSFSQTPVCENIFIISTDGYRWQEVFNGADSSILFNTQYVADTQTSRYLYWAPSIEERRKKLMPFVWNFIVEKGQLWGNRFYNNNVSVSNPYRFSYAGYNEILTGFADWKIITNKPKNNKNANVLSYLNTLPPFKDKVAAFGSWKLFSYIINGTSKKIPLNCGYLAAEGDDLTYSEQMVNYIQQSSSDNQLPTRSDFLTFTLASEYIKKNHPKVVFIGFGETDEYAHHEQYDKYLSHANLFDKMLSDLWSQIQQDDFYKNKTTLFITTDHGRGKKPDKWMKHGLFTSGSDETWMIQIGPNITALGETKLAAEISNQQFAQTIAAYLGESFIADHPVAPPMTGINK